jgi:cytochrome c5
MKRLLIFAMSYLVASCASTNYAPPVTSQMAKAGAKQHVDLATLRAGRTLFVSRCIECHTLPLIATHAASDWPKLIDEMAGRANLKPGERKAVLAYILTARTQL